MGSLTILQLQVEMHKFSTRHPSLGAFVFTSMVDNKETSRQALEYFPEILFRDIPWTTITSQLLQVVESKKTHLLIYLLCQLNKSPPAQNSRKMRCTSPQSFSNVFCPSSSIKCLYILTTCGVLARASIDNHLASDSSPSPHIYAGPIQISPPIHIMELSRAYQHAAPA